MVAETASVTNTRAAIPKRLVFLDNLRVLLISLIVLLHLAINYGAPGDWYTREVQFDSLSFVSMLIFIIYNTTVQAFALGFFFLISGYFTAASLEKKGTRGFISDRLIRLGIPLVVYTVLINPAIIYLLYGRHIPFFTFMSDYFAKGKLSTGPMWFVAALLIFSLVHIVLAAMTDAGAGASRNTGTTSMPSMSRLFLLAFATGLVAFAIRFISPVGRTIPILNFQFSYFTQYIVMFVIGTMAWRVRWFNRVSEYCASAWLGFTVLIVMTLPVMFVVGIKGGGDVFNGGMSWQALSYSIWEPFVCLGAVIGLSALFGTRLNGLGGWFAKLPPNTYLVYVIHPVVVIALTTAFARLELPPLMKFVVMTPIVLVGCFVTAGMLRKIPSVATIV